MSSNPGFSLPVSGPRFRPFAHRLALAATLGLASTAGAFTMPLHLADAPSGRFLDAPTARRTETEAFGLGVGPGALEPTGIGTGEVPTPAPETRRAGGTPMPSLAGFPGRVGRDLVHLMWRPFSFDVQDWTRFALGVGAVGGVAAFDNRIRSVVERGGSSSSTTFATRIRPIGTWGGLAVMGAALAAGDAFRDASLVAMGLDGVEATLFTGALIVPVLKEVVGRARPNSGQGPSEADFLSGRQSFPSGEVAVAFTDAAVISQHTDSVAVRGVAWGLAGLVGWERMRLDAHWASDVVAGALIGTAVGSWVATIHRPGEPNGPTTVSVLPIVGPRTVGVTASLAW